MNDGEFNSGMVVGAFLMFLLFSITTFVFQLWPHQVSHKLKTEAVTRGHAQWVVHPNGTIEFEWLEPLSEAFRSEAAIDAAKGGQS